MALPIGGKVLLDTTVLINFLRAGMHAEWVLGGYGTIVRFISAVALLELRLGPDAPKRKTAVERLHQAFQPGRVLGLTPIILDHAGRLFRAMYGNAGIDRPPGLRNDMLMALTAREIGATIVTRKLQEFLRIATKLPGPRVAAP